MAKKKTKAKKSKKKVGNKVKKKKISSKTKPLAKSKIELKQPSKIASVLVLIAIVVLAFYGLFALIFSNSVINFLKDTFGPNTTITTSILITHGIAWIILAFLMYLSNKEIRKTMDRSWMWFLLIISVVTIILFITKSVGAVAVLAGLLALIAAIIYLLKK